MLERMLAKSLRVSGLPFLVVLERCTTLARLDLGILGWWSGVSGMSELKIEGIIYRVGLWCRLVWPEPGLGLIRPLAT